MLNIYILLKLSFSQSPICTVMLGIGVEWMSLDKEEFQNSKEVQKISGILIKIE